MRGRGRPKTPSVLTPRESEVLDLLRRGLTNRDIANELQISLSGAKYHVSEIISKLGVATREEAATWRPETSKRWGFVPFGLLGSLRVSLVSTCPAPHRSWQQPCS
jgi:DNA-binding CsgD family transcriptional regulator